MCWAPWLRSEDKSQQLRCLLGICLPCWPSAASSSSQPLPPQRANSKTGPVMKSHLDGWAEPEPAGVHTPRHPGEQKRAIHRQNRVLFLSV